MIKILTVLLIQGVEGHTHGQFVWKQSPVKSSKQEFSSNVSKRSSAREKNEPTTSKNFNWPSHWKSTWRFPRNFVFWFTELFLVVLNFLSCKFVTTLLRIFKKIWVFILFKCCGYFNKFNIYIFFTEFGIWPLFCWWIFKNDPFNLFREAMRNTVRRYEIQADL